MDKVYVIVSVRSESKDIISLELLDESSQPPVIKTAFFRLSPEEYKELGEPVVQKKIKISMTL